MGTDPQPLCNSEDFVIQAEDLNGSGAMQEETAKVEAKDESEELTDGHWPFQSVADQLLLDCLHSAWETRHGACLALREILSCQAKSAAVTARVVDEPSGRKSILFNSYCHKGSLDRHVQRWTLSCC